MLFNGDYYLVGYHNFYLVVSSLGRVQLVRSIILLKSMHELVTKKIGYGLSNRRTLVAYNRSRYIHVPICIRSRHLRNLYPRWPYCSLINGYHRRLLPTIYYTYYWFKGFKYAFFLVMLEEKRRSVKGRTTHGRLASQNVGRLP
jgi:hypothetical protein